MATTLEVERQLSNAGYAPQGVDFSPRLSAPADIEGIVRGAAARYSIDPDQATAIARLESGLNPRAQNPNSSAGGLFQFINSTWGQYGGGDKYDPVRNADAGARYLRDVRDTLTRGLGREPTVGELYLGHQQGPAGALRILQNPDGLARDAVGPDAVVLNGGTIGMTNRDFAARWDRRAARAAGQSPGILDTIGAAARQNIGLISLLGYGGTFHRGLDDPTFNAITTADADPSLRPYLSQFVDVSNRDEYDQTAERIRRASDDKETLAAAGPFGTVASVAAGILDPINIIPVGGGAWKLLRAGRYVEGALGGLIAGGGGAALQEFVLQQADPTRTAEDAGLNIVGGALGGAGLGVGAIAAGESASRLARAGILGTGGAAGGAAAGLAEALYSGQGLGDSLATIGTSAVIGGLLGGSVGALARPGRTAPEGMRDMARAVDIDIEIGNGAVYADVRRQLLAAGRPGAEADAGGRLWQSHVDAVSRATGMAQADVYRGIGLDVRTGDVPEDALAQFRPPHEIQWTKDIDSTLSGKLGRGITPTTGLTPNVLRAIGVPADRPVAVPPPIIRKTMLEKHAGEVPEVVLKQLPRLLRDPVMVVRSQTEEGRLVAVLDAAGPKGGPIVVVIDPRDQVIGRGHAAVVASIHERDNAKRWIVNHMSAGDVLYANSAKAPALLRRLGVPDDIGRALSPAARLPVASPEGLRNDGAESPPRGTKAQPSAGDGSTARPRPQRTDAPTLGAGCLHNPKAGKG